MSSILEIKDLSYYYQDGDKKRVIFDNANYKFEEGKFYSIVGESGSGKTTLLILLAGLDDPKSGEVLYKGTDIKDIGYDTYHKKDVQIIFQAYNLLNYLNAYDNIKTAISISDPKRKIDNETLKNYLDRFGISEEKALRKVNKLSGGEQQRVAIARAIASDAKVILADEPTGNLDYETSMSIIRLFKELVDKYGKTVIMVTHNLEIADITDKIVKIDQNNKGIYE